MAAKASNASAAASSSAAPTVSPEELMKLLRSTRKDHNEEALWHRFLLDALHGTGGFKGKYGPSRISCLGWAAEAYGHVSAIENGVVQPIEARLTYLDQFPREDVKKFERRIDVAHYTNYTGPIHELIISYVHKNEMSFDEEPDDIKEWKLDVDGKGTTWDTMMKEVVQPRASGTGWCPVLFDMPASEPGVEISQAEAKARGHEVRAMPLFALNILDWMSDAAGDLLEVKIRIDHVVRANLLSPCHIEEHYAHWTRKTVTKYVITRREGQPEVVSDPETREHTFGCVPIIVFRGKPTPDDKVRGLSIVGDLAKANRDHFNRESEFVDHLRGQVFALLGLPMKDTSQDIGEVVGGNNSIIKIPMESNMPLHYVAPPDSVAEAYETRLEASVKEMYRTSRIEYEAPTGQATSGVARAYAFEGTNRRLGDLAGGFARSQQACLRLVGKIKNTAAAEHLTVTAPTDFALEDLATDINNLMQALGLELGKTATTEMKKRLVGKALPNLPSKTKTVIEEELEEQGHQDDQDDALEREVKRSILDDQKENGGQTKVGVPGTGVAA